MSQRTQIVVGDDVVAGTLQEIFSNLSSPGILSGMDLTVNSNSINVSPGVALTDSGVFIFQDETTETNSLVPVPGTNYTVLYRYVASVTLGGSPASLVVEAGLLNPDTFDGGVILGWIKHTSGATFDQADIIPARRFKLGVSDSNSRAQLQMGLAPLSNKWAQVTGNNLSITEGWSNTDSAIVTTITNSLGTNQALTFNYPILIPVAGVGQLVVECEVPNTANLVVTFIDTDGVSYDGSPNQANWTLIAIPMQRRFLSVAQSLALEVGKVCYIKLSMNIQPGSYIRFKGLGFNSYTEPF